MSLAVKSITAIIMMGIFVMNLLAVIGMGYLTKFSFHNENKVLGVETDKMCYAYKRTTRFHKVITCFILDRIGVNVFNGYEQLHFYNFILR